MTAKNSGLKDVITDIQGRFAASLDEITARPQAGAVPTPEPTLNTTVVITNLPRPAVNSAFAPSILHGGFNGSAPTHSDLTSQSNEQSQRQGQNQTPLSASNTHAGAVAPRPAVNSALAPTVFTGNLNGQPYASCFRQAVGQSPWTGGLIVTAFSSSFGRSVSLGEDGECIKLVQRHLADQRLAQSGKEGENFILRRDFDNPVLATAVEAARAPYSSRCDAAEPTTVLLTGICHPEAVCPPGKSAVWDLPHAKFTCN